MRHQITAFFLFLAGVLCFVGFLAALRQRVAVAEDAPGAMEQLAFGAGIASAVLWIVAIMFFAGPGFIAADTGAKDVVPATFRTLNDTGYLAWIGATVIGALTVWGTSAVAIRTSFLPRWFGWSAYSSASSSCSRSSSSRPSCSGSGSSSRVPS